MIGQVREDGQLVDVLG